MTKAEKKAARAPDKEKLAKWSAQIDEVCNHIPTVSSPEANDIINSTVESIGRALKLMSDMMKELL